MSGPYPIWVLFYKVVGWQAPSLSGFRAFPTMAAYSRPKQGYSQINHLETDRELKPIISAKNISSSDVQDPQLEASTEASTEHTEIITDCLFI